MCPALVGLFRILRLLLGLAAAQNLGQAVPDAAEQQRAAQVLERHERIVDAEQDRRQLEVHQEDDDAEVDEGVRGRDQIRLLVQHEDDRRDQGRLGVAVGG